MQRIDSTLGRLALHGKAGTRRIEERANAALPSGALMRRAGEAVAQLAIAIAPHARRVWIAAGPGNNGGDGLEAAVALKRSGKDVGVMLVGIAAALPADAAAALVRARDAGVAIDRPAGSLGRNDIAIDALLGIGGSRAPQGALADAVSQLGALDCPVLAIDVPSGLDVDTGQPFGADCVTAQHTLALLTLKPGLFTASGRDCAGTVWLDRLGVEDGSEAEDAVLVGSGVAALQAGLRRHAMHKGSFGDVAVVGGASGMVGAAILAARAAHAAGAGRVYAVLSGADVPPPDHDPLRPELMFRPGWLGSIPQVLADCTVVCGCGGGNAVRDGLPRLFSLVRRLVLDADALNAIAGDAGLQSALRSRTGRGLCTVLTPHPLEAARLLGCTTAEIQRDRLHAAQALAERCASVVVLKGSGSVIAAPGRTPAINATGNASLASPGTGDVLAGWLGGLWAQTISTPEAPTGFDVALRAVVEHGAAAEPFVPGPLRAADLVERLHRRLRASA